MVQLKKKQVRIVSVLIALVFVGSVVALALTQSGSGIVSAASSSVGLVDMETIVQQHPKYQSSGAEFQKFMEDTQKEMEQKAANMSDQEKQEYANQMRQRVMQKNQELMEPIKQDIDDNIKKVAEAKGLQVVLDKSAVVYGGTDVTQDVINKLK